MTEKPYDLLERTFEFARNTRKFVFNVRKTIVNMEDCKQLLRSSGSVGANYREAREAISQKDFVFRLRICRKEASESAYWIGLIFETISDKEKEELKELKNEADQLIKIFTASIRKLEIQKINLELRT
jgi:four helix bundle protein